ncbi:BlaI/MecI/CopY family transcriptional regulator [Streptomyces sp. LHD-70]|uniref:BlaI/MecI/CopY family transcriptional regulator n=1 Tax=Streptomyces sp. LHD-70 TaxID=3072140 RepID=UPI00280F26F9|nr:BlaI/MecI/CopY family transcriptional regulator [Streptomyces sp. LHD-70]MDQ8706512.1 BlaI/MecI/CopY family transcriptional regulator [Streptomyces sp. LHD-70]
MWNLGSLEAEVMERLWAAGRPLPVRDVVDAMNAERPAALAYTTVMSTMAKLNKKGWLDRTRQGKQYLYQPHETREACTARLMAEALSGSGDPESVLLHFVERVAASESPDLQAAIRRALGDEDRA